MTALPQTFNPNEIPEDDRNFDPIPAGTYKLQVTESKLEEARSGEGNQILTLTLEVLDGPYQNRKIWDRLNIINKNQTAQQIAQRALADLCLACGLNSIKDTEELHFKPFTARVTIQPDKTGQYAPQNRVRYTVGKGAPQGQPQTQQAAGNKQPQQAKGGGAAAPTRPWGAGAQANKAPF